MAASHWLKATPAMFEIKRRTRQKAPCCVPALGKKLIQKRDHSSRAPMHIKTKKRAVLKVKATQSPKRDQQVLSRVVSAVLTSRRGLACEMEHGRQPG